MLRKVSVLTGLVLAVGAVACGSDGGAHAMHEAGNAAFESSTESPPNASPTETPPSATLAAVSDPRAPASEDDTDEASDSTPQTAVPPRDLDRPSFAGACLSDGDICPEGDCPTFGGVLATAGHGAIAGWAVRDYCVAEDGEPFISLGFTDGGGVIYVFRAGSGEVVSRVVSDDGAYFCADTAPSNWLVTGRFIPDCMWVRDVAVPCTDQATPDLGAFENCFYDMDG